MSRTDKDRPFWVIEIQENAPIKHDHRNGVCIEETPNHGKSRWGHGRRHYRECKKRYQYTWTCTKKDPDTYTRGYRSLQECWTWRCRCNVPRPKRHMTQYGPLYHEDHIDACPTWGRVQCEGHSEWRYDDSVPCVCDDWLSRPTCTYDLGYGGKYYSYTWGGVPTWYVRQTYHRPERARERQLRDMAREYNTYGDIEDDDFVNRQARNSARWDWW